MKAARISFLRQTLLWYGMDKNAARRGMMLAKMSKEQKKKYYENAVKFNWL